LIGGSLLLLDATFVDGNLDIFNRTGLMHISRLENAWLPYATVISIVNSYFNLIWFSNYNTLNTKPLIKKLCASFFVVKVDAILPLFGKEKKREKCQDERRDDEEGKDYNFKNG
jgi:hypothetical protein